MSFSEAVYDAVDIRNESDSRAKIHELVGRQIKRLDPGASITPTSYFNHSFVPDFIVNWSHADQENERDVFLRMDVTSAAFIEELRHFEGRDPLVLGVYDERPLTDAASSERDRDLLVTQVRAVDEFDEGLDADSRTTTATREVVRAGRGSIDSVKAQNISSQFREALTTIDGLRDSISGDTDVDTIRQAMNALDPVLAEDGSIQVEQTLRALWIRQGGSPSRFPGRTGWNPQNVSSETLRAILDDLLDGDARGIDPATWTELAGHVSAEEIGRLLGRPLSGGTFNEMAAALAPGWTVKWAWAEEHSGESLVPEPFEWLISEGLLGVHAGDIRIFLADDGRHFKDKPEDLALPSLRDTLPMLEQSDVRGVALRAPLDDIEVNLRTEDSPRSLAEAVTEGLAEPGESGHQLKAVTVSVPRTSRTARVDFASKKIDFDYQPTDVRVAAELAAKFFAGFDVTRLNEFRTFLGIESDGET